MPCCPLNGLAVGNGRLLSASQVGRSTSSPPLELVPSMSRFDELLFLNLDRLHAATTKTIANKARTFS
jgi:hypothetical protein